MAETSVEVGSVSTRSQADLLPLREYEGGGKGASIPHWASAEFSICITQEAFVMDSPLFYKCKYRNFKKLNIVSQCI